MDKQKQIEEMARIIAFDLCPNRSVHANWGEEAQCYSDNNFAECTQIKNVVDKLINAGYRKIHENAVVLTEEEYKKLTTPTISIKTKSLSQKELDKKLKEMSNYGIIGIDESTIEIIPSRAEIEKETAEKFAELAKAKLNEWLKDNEDNDGKIDFGIAEIELIGVKSLEGEVISESLIDEIAKEITDKEVQNGG